VSTAADVACLSHEERRTLVTWIAQQEAPAEAVRVTGRRRRVTLMAVTATAIVLVPWTIALSLTLPSRYTSHQWRLAWVGFDVALLVVLAVTGWSGWRSRQIVVTALVVTGTLLLCDAWFDLTMSWSTGEQTAALITAACVEIPFALWLFVIAGRLLRGITTYLWQLSGEPGDAPRLFTMPLLIASPPRERRGARVNGRRTSKRSVDRPIR
jgi:hypothetical protein